MCRICITRGSLMNIALVAHDKKKQDIIAFSTAYKHVFQKHQLFATGTTGNLISKATGLEIHRFQSGPLGGDQQIGAMIDRKSTRLNSSHVAISYAVFC